MQPKFLYSISMQSRALAWEIYNNAKIKASSQFSDIMMPYILALILSTH